MQVTFVGLVDTFHEDADGAGVTFAQQPGHYRAPLRPPDLIETLRYGLQSGRRLRVTYDDLRRTITDVVLA